MDDFFRTGWVRFPADPEIAEWAARAAPVAAATMHDPELRAAWLRCGGTWFAGVNVLPNAASGQILGAPLAGPVIDALGWPGPWDRAQLSVVRPGYPRRDPGEGEAAHRYRRTRDAAHLDGLLPVGPERRRMAQESHAFVLGIGLSAADPGAAPFVLWEGSHIAFRTAFARALAGRSPAEWRTIDLTAVYHATRRSVFADCPRIAVAPAPGESVLIDRFTLHGTAPWEPDATSAPEGRMIAWFRPDIPIRDWFGPAPGTRSRPLPHSRISL